ncbi:hypothetical protein FRC00_007499 [Tulasnella sp. 408]|nr:hypothetical protein FRC00_007499 [Tulasnella sp. 408]
MDPALDSLLSVSDCDSAIAQHRDEAQVIQIKRRRNSLLPISRLHPELFHHILQLALFHARDGYEELRPESCRSHYTNLFALRRVSHGWEHEIVNTPRLWAPISHLLNTSLQNLIWERSGAAALEVDLSSYHDFWSASEKAFLERIMTREIRELRALVPKCETLDSYIADHHHPRLKVLALWSTDEIVCTRPLRTPQLEELYITRCNINWDHLHNLRVLSIDDPKGSNLAQLVQILQSSPRLEQLFLTRIDVPSDGAAVPLTPIYLPQLSTIHFTRMWSELTSGLLERLITSAECGLSDIFWSSSEWPSPLRLFHQAGRICTPQGSGKQIIDPKLSLIKEHWRLETAPGRYLYTLSFSYRRTTRVQLAEAARVFFATSKGLPSTARSSRFRLGFTYMSHLAEGLEIVHENFPETVELDVGCSEGVDVLAVLAEPQVKEGNSVWLLPNLAVLKFYPGSYARDYGCIAAMAIKRTQAATASPTIVAPIRSLTLGRGYISLELLGRLEEAGIKCEQNGVDVVV